jgi:hypothetical protein
MLVGGRARAGNQESVFLGNQAAMSGGAVAAWVNDGGAPWYNPAGLATIAGTSVDLSASAFVVRHYVLPDAARTLLADETITEDASFTEVVSVPAALTVMRKFSDDVAGALAVFVPYQEDILVSAAFDRQRPGFRYRWTFSASRRAARYYAGPAIGVRLSDRIHLGLSLFGTYETRLTARDFFSSLDAPTSRINTALLTVDQKLDQKLFGATAVLGLRWNVDDAWSAAVVLRPPLFHVAGKAQVDFTGTQTAVDRNGDLVIQAESGQQDSEPDKFDVMEPGRVQLGVARKLVGGRVSAQFEWQSAATGGDVERRAIVNGRVGASFPIADTIALGGGLFTDLSPNRQPSDLGETKVDFYGGSLGMRFSTAHEVMDEEQEEETKGLVFSTTVALRYALGLGEIGGLRFAPTSAPERFVSEVMLHELSLHIGSALDF